MEYRKFGDSYVVRMDRGEEILTRLTELCDRENIRLAQVQALGAVDHVIVSVYDVPTRSFFKKEFILKNSGLVKQRYYIFIVFDSPKNIFEPQMWVFVQFGLFADLRYTLYYFIPKLMQDIFFICIVSIERRP